MSDVPEVNILPEILAWMAANLSGADAATRLRKAIEALGLPEVPKEAGR